MLSDLYKLGNDRIVCTWVISGFLAFGSLGPREGVCPLSWAKDYPYETNSLHATFLSTPYAHCLIRPGIKPSKPKNFKQVVVYCSSRLGQVYGLGANRLAPERGTSEWDW